MTNPIEQANILGQVTYKLVDMALEFQRVVYEDPQEFSRVHSFYRLPIYCNQAVVGVFKFLI